MKQTMDSSHIRSGNIHFSVIVPLYNKASYIRKALASINTQTYRCFELIVVNDGSSDGSAAIAEAYLKNKTKIDYQIINQSNSGVAVARNIGVFASKGDYVVFLDADDWWEPTFLEEMARLIKEYPDAGLYATNYIYYKPGKTLVALNMDRGYMNYPKVYLQYGSMPVTSITTCMPRKVFDEMGGFPLGIKLGEDFLLWAKTALHYKVAFCEKPLAYYNNDVPAHLRATRNLHAPKHHMLFHLDQIENEIEVRSSSNPFIHSSITSWKALLDKLRVSGLMDYWLCDEYHDAAAAELANVDWSKQPKNAKSQYEKPIWLLRAERRFMQIGSFFKQKLIRMIK